MDLSYNALELAAARLRPELATPAQRAKALACLNTPRWSIEPDDDLVLRIEPSEASTHSSRSTRSYEVRRNSCTCKGFFTRGCYHPAAWEIVAEAKTPTITVGGSLSAAFFVQALSLVVSAGVDSVTVRASSHTAQLTLAVSEVMQIALVLDLHSSCRASVELGGAVPLADVTLLRDELLEFPLALDEQLDLDIDSDTLLLCDSRATQSFGFEFQ